MAYKIILTEQDISKAKSYINLMDKDNWVKGIASSCIDRVDIAAKEGDFTIPMPPIYKDNLQRKSRYLMGFFVKSYLEQSYEPTEDDWLMAADDYDGWAGSHIFNQLERFKGKPDVRDKVFDLLADYRDLEKRLNTEVYSHLQIYNDMVARAASLIQMQSTPGVMQQGLDELKKVRDELMDYAESKKGGG